jgi:hypothetical protein
MVPSSRAAAAFASIVVVALVTMIASGSSSRGLSLFGTSRSGHGIELLEAGDAASSHGLSSHSGSGRSAAAHGRGERDAMLGGKGGAMTESLSMSASARHKLSRAVAKAGRAPTESERRDMTADLDRIAGLLATQEVAFPSQTWIPTQFTPLASTFLPRVHPHWHHEANGTRLSLASVFRARVLWPSSPSCSCSCSSSCSLSSSCLASCS